MFSAQKNSYLQCQTGGINPRLLNRAVNLARNNPVLQQNDALASGNVVDSADYTRLASEQPYHPVCQADITRRPLALPLQQQVIKLMRELHSKDTAIVLAALTSLTDVLHDPEKAYIALKLHIVNRLADLLRKPLETTRERSCCVLIILAGAADGKQLIMNNIELVFSIRQLLHDVDSFVRLKASLLVRTIASFWPTADELLENGFMSVLLDSVSRYSSSIQTVCLDAITYLMYNLPGKEAAYQNNAFHILVHNLHDIKEEEILAKSLVALAMLLYLPECKLNALDKEVDLLKTLDGLLKHDNPAIYNAAAETIMFATVKMRAKMEMVRFLLMPRRLIELAGNCINEATQTYSIKALTNISEYPPLRLLICNTYIKQIEAIPVKSADVQRYKDILLEVAGDVSNLGQVIFDK